MKIKRIRPELFVLILLIFCISFIIRYDQNSGRSGAAVSIDESGQVMILHMQEDLVKHKEDGRQVISYRPDACQLIEIYDSELNIIFSLSFTKDQSISQYISEHGSLLNISGVDGSRVIRVNDNDYTVDLSWDSVGDKEYLIVYVSAKYQEKVITFFKMICYLTLILSLTLFTNTFYWNSRNVARRYKQVNKEIKRTL